MKFYNYINELDDQKRKYLIEHLKKCKSFINDLKRSGSEGFLYSGRSSVADYLIKDVRKNRQPLDTPLEIHKWVDDAFYDKFRIRARSNTLFCTGFSGMAAKYGNPYYIFPIGNYEIIWSKTIFDLYSKLTEIQNDESIIKNIVSNYQKGDLKGAIASKNEIMLYCDKYLMIRSLNLWKDELRMILKEI